MKKTYIAIGVCCWGKAPSIDEAIKNASKEWPTFVKGKKTFQVYEVHPDTHVNGMGGLTYPIKHKPKQVS